MKTIQLQPIWVNGIEKNATVFYLQTNSDNLKDSATFYFQLYEEIDINIHPITNGTITMRGDDYIIYSSSAISNDFAYNWAANELKLIITGDYIPPAPPSATATIPETNNTI